MKANTSAAVPVVRRGMGLAPAESRADRQLRPLPLNPPPGGLGAWLAEIGARRDLVVMLVWREIKVEVQTSGWDSCGRSMPALIVSAGVIVKYAYASVSGIPFRPVT